MKKWIACVVMITTSIMTTIEVSAQRLPAKKDILQSMRLANNYFMSKWPDAGKTIITNKERQSNIWTRAVYY
jgi:unsaturated rhamnogalacturonyl hydrolase